MYPDHQACAPAQSSAARAHLGAHLGSPGHTWWTYLHGVRRAELHLGEIPDTVPWLVHFPDFLVKAGPVPSVEGEDIVIALLELVIKRQAAGHGGRGHRGDELRHLLEVLDVNRVHVHVVA